MEITVTGRKKQITDRFRRHLEDKLEKIPQIAPRVARTDVVLTHESNPRQSKSSDRVEITCHAKRTVVRAEAAAEEEFAALDLAMTKLLERLRRINDRRRISRTGKRLPSSVAEATAALPPDPVPADGPAPAGSDGLGKSAEDEVDEALGTAGNSPIEVRQKTHASAPMTLGAALNEMELVGHDFYLYCDAETKQPSVVYRRRGWSYGVLHLEVAEADGSSERSGATDVVGAGQAS